MSDEAILDMIFTPGLDGMNLEMLEPAPAPKPADVPGIAPELLSRLRTLEASAIVLAESKQYDSALSKLDELLSQCPSYASGYNNRAQVRQLLHAAAPGSASLTPESRREALQPALDDLNKALELASASGDRLVQRQAHTQRALLRRAIGDEEGALADYQRGAALGSQFAKKEAVKLNPYAKLCNQYLQAALENHWSGIGDASSSATDGAKCDAASCSNQSESK